MANSDANCSTDTIGYDSAIGQLANCVWTIRITRRLSYGQSTLNMFKKLTAIKLPGDGCSLDASYLRTWQPSRYLGLGKRKDCSNNYVNTYCLL